MRGVVIQKGFTLLEAIIYVALFMLVIGGGVISAYSIFEGSMAIREMNTIEAEANFLQRKFDWALNGSAIVEPDAGETGGVLTVDIDGVEYTLELDGTGVVTIFDGAGDPKPLTTDNVNVSDLLFAHAPATGGTPESLSFSFSINDREIGTTTRYVR